MMIASFYHEAHLCLLLVCERSNGNRSLLLMKAGEKRGRSVIFLQGAPYRTQE
jgi:hypothetical protein